MRQLNAPANLTIMELPPQRLAPLKPVRALDHFDGGPDTFHEDGLFSTSIFGRVGSDDRDRRFSYIDIKATIFHPLIFQHLVALKGLYGGIMQGKAFAVWDEAEKDFVASDEVHGQTGYDFFFAHWKQIEFKSTGSAQRDARIALVQKYKDKATVNKVLVLPAGLRDFEIDESGRRREGEINEFYRSMLSTSNSIGTTSDVNAHILNNSRYSLQIAFNKVFDFLIDQLSGKGGFIQDKWGSRNIIGGTRNVITAMDTSAPVLGQPNYPKQNNTVLGLFQAMKGAVPLVKHSLLTGIVGKAFQTTDGVAYLVNKATMQMEQVRVTPTVRDRWATTNGLDAIINFYREPSVRHRPVEIEGYYLGLIYKPKDRKVYRIFQDIRELPESMSKADVYPLTYVEMLYLSCHAILKKLTMFSTRYPVAGVGSSTPSIVYVKTTVRAEMRVRLDEKWEEPSKIATEEDTGLLALEFPILDGKPEYFDTMAIHSSRLAAAAADHDGDMMSSNMLITDDANAEVHAHLNSVQAYLNPRGGLKASAAVDTVERVLVALSRRRK